MRRVSSILFGMLLLLAAFASTGFSASTVAAAETATAGHALVGTWLADTDSADPENPPALFMFTSDGTYSQIESDGSMGYGVWKATSETTADLTAWIMGQDENGDFGGMVIVRASITLSDDGMSFTAPYTLEFVAPDGSASGQAGPGEASGVKLAAEPMGAPVMTLEEMFGGPGEEDPANSVDDEGGSEGEDESPEATPVS